MLEHFDARSACGVLGVFTMRKAHAASSDVVQFELQDEDWWRFPVMCSARLQWALMLSSLVACVVKNGSPAAISCDSLRPEKQHCCQGNRGNLDFSRTASAFPLIQTTKYSICCRPQNRTLANDRYHAAPNVAYVAASRHGTIKRSRVQQLHLNRPQPHPMRSSCTINPSKLMTKSY